jgi:hypothetical protein
MRPVRFLLGAMAALALAPAVAGAQTALPVEDALSVNSQTFINDNMAPDPFLKVAAGAGWTGARSDAFWANVEPTQADVANPNKWAPFDAIKAKYDAGGVRWLPILESSPGWARNASRGFSLALPTQDHYGDFARFAAEFAQRYGPGGAKAGALPVHDIELYNEENTPGAGAYTAYPADYAQLFIAGRNAIKAAQPSMRVVVGAILYDSDAPTDADYIKGMFATPGMAADAIALHPYAPTAIGIANNLRRMQQGLVDAGQAALPIYVNELGYPAALDGATPQPRATLGPTTDESRAGTVTFVTDTLLASDCNVRNIAYFDLVSQETNKADTSYLDSETWKGLERKAGAALTITGQAYRDAGARWRANPVPGTIHLCGAAGAPGTGPMPIDLDVERPSASCLRPRVTYRGFPLEESTVFITKPDGNTAAAPLTIADGHLPNDFCSDSGQTYTVVADVSASFVNVPRFGYSRTLSCKLGSTAACTPVSGSGPTPPGGGTTPPGGGAGTVALSDAGECLLKSFKASGTTRLRTVLSRGLRVRASGCRKVATGTVTSRKVAITATVARGTARSLHLTRTLAKRPTKVASLTKRLTSARDVTLVVRFTRSARARLAKARRVRVSIAVAITEGTTKRTLTRTVTLRR